MVARFPLRGVHIFARGAAEAEDAIGLLIPLPAPPQGENEAPLAVVYVTQAQRKRLGIEALCGRPCCARLVQLPLLAEEVAA